MRYFFGILLLVGCHWAYADDIVRSDAQPRSDHVGDSSSIALHRFSDVGGEWGIAETPNFRIYSCASDKKLRQLADDCERLGASLKDSWLSREFSRRWVPKCDVVIHVGVGEYVQCLGPGSEHTSGCSTIQFDRGRVVGRRLDFRADAADWKSDCLPHELTHLVLADRFCQNRISPWADEGIAMLSESREKRDRRLAELRRAAAYGMTYAARDLLNVERCPEPAFRDAFYGESLSLVSLLLQWGTKEQLLQFVEASHLNGLDAALRDVYPNRQAIDLERRLREYRLSDRRLTSFGVMNLAATSR